jgi:hypothetical protein
MVREAGWGGLSAGLIIHFNQNKRVNEVEVNGRSEVVTDC